MQQIQPSPANASQRWMPNGQASKNLTGDTCQDNTGRVGRVCSVHQNGGSAVRRSPQPGTPAAPRCRYQAAASSAWRQRSSSSSQVSRAGHNGGEGYKKEVLPRCSWELHASRWVALTNPKS